MSHNHCDHHHFGVCCSFTAFIGRLFIAVIFLLSGINKFVDFNATAAILSTKIQTAPSTLLFIAALVEIIGALSLILGFKTRFGALLLFLFLIPTTYLFHDFWNYTEEAARAVQQINFLKNLAIMGGLLYVVSSGAGCLSLDHLFCRKKHDGGDSCCAKEADYSREVKTREGYNTNNPPRTDLDDTGTTQFNDKP